MKILLKTAIFTLLAPGTVAFLVPLILLSLSTFRWDIGATHYLGIPVFLAGIAIYVWCAWDFGAAGKGTPSPNDPPKALVARGLYRYVRNPMYLGVLSIILGEAIWFAAPVLLVYIAIAFLVVHLRVLYYEEPVLERTFGQSYQQYRQTVPRWLPRLDANSHEA